MVSDGERPPLCRVSSLGFLVKRIIPRVNSRQAARPGGWIRRRKLDEHTSFSCIPSSIGAYLLPACLSVPSCLAGDPSTIRPLMPSPNTWKSPSYQSPRPLVKTLNKLRAAKLPRLIDSDRSPVEISLESFTSFEGFQAIPSDFRTKYLFIYLFY